MANWNNPTLTSTYTNFVTEVKDRDVEAAVWFEGMSPTNLPTNAKRLNTTTGRFEKWNGTAWVDAVATFTFPALSVAGTFGVTGVATFTANPVMNGGTANGIAYLNGTKVLTTGSALTFDGNFELSIANAASSANNKLILGGFNSFGNAYVLTGPSSATNAFYVGTQTNIPLIFVQNSADGMRLDSIGLGIGKTPEHKFDVAGTGAFRGIQTSGTPSLSFNASKWMTQVENDSVARTYFCGPNASTYSKWEIYRATSTGSPSLHTTFDAAGNVSIGVPNSPWGFGKALEVGALGNALWGASANEIRVMQNAYYSDADRYASSGAASIYRQVAGVHQWFSAPAGTIGNPINFIEGLSLDASANLIGSGTGYWRVPRGTTAQRPTGASGMIRFNSSLNKYEGHNGSAWSSIGGGATGGGSDDVFYENGQTVTTNYTLNTNKNAMSAGPITIASGITVTVPSGSNWVVI